MRSIKGLSAITCQMMWLVGRTQLFHLSFLPLRTYAHILLKYILLIAKFPKTWGRAGFLEMSAHRMVAIFSPMFVNMCFVPGET